MALGDYGNEYGEYRWGVFLRLVHRMLGRSYHCPKAHEYFDIQDKIFQLPIDSVLIDIGLDYKVDGNNIKFQTREGKSMTLSKEEFMDALKQDMVYALGVHVERIELELLGEGIRVKISDVAEVADYRFSKKKRPWKTWSSYFGAKPQPLAVVAQTAREKGFMVDDDLSDFYQGKVTAGIPEGKVSVTVASPSCKEFERILKIHKFECLSVKSDKAPLEAQSPLYGLAAKEKLSGQIGVAAEASYTRTMEKFGVPWPDLAAIDDFDYKAGKASFSILEKNKLVREIKVKELVKKLPLQVDVIHGSSCLMDSYPLDTLTPGGVVIIEGTPCNRHVDKFKQFLKDAQKIGTVLIGRNIAAIIKTGTYKHDSQRARWPQRKMEKQDL
eukprot:TRINITY_DN36015_c0_g1_i1.p1 TRINITY_DN36015_c0_g1~~TRINITY_DN36015_c0_g1_i1.p1  ORF type:complete len:409 (-),score=68.68 TRINITY_DN36015_c0_g1_i1:104-1255(-)